MKPILELQLPYNLMEINNIFSFYFLGLDNYQTEESIKFGGLTGNFGIQYNSIGIQSNFVCDVTIGNVYNFYLKLQECNKNIDGIAILNDYSNERTNLKIKFYKFGHCNIDGLFYDSISKSSIKLELQIEQTIINDCLNKMSKLFNQLILIQGNSNFV